MQRVFPALTGQSLKGRLLANQSSDISQQRPAPGARAFFANPLGLMLVAALGAWAAYKGAESVQFQYEDVTRYYVKPVQLDAFISQGKPRDGLVTTNELLEADKLYVFTSVVKARKIVVEATKSNGGSLAVDIPVIKEIVGGNIEIAPENSANTR